MRRAALSLALIVLAIWQPRVCTCAVHGDELETTTDNFGAAAEHSSDHDDAALSQASDGGPAVTGHHEGRCSCEHSAECLSQRPRPGIRTGDSTRSPFVVDEWSFAAFSPVGGMPADVFDTPFRRLPADPDHPLYLILRAFRN